MLHRCFDEYDCWLRSQRTYDGGQLGSSKWQAKTAGAVNFGMDYENWSQALLIYCDGSSFTGYVDHAVNVSSAVPIPGFKPPPSNATVYFRGRINLQAALEVSHVTCINTPLSPCFRNGHGLAVLEPHILSSSPYLSFYLHVFFFV